MKIQQKIANNYLLWFNTVAVEETIPLAHKVVIFLSFIFKLYPIYIFVCSLNLLLAFFTDITIRDKRMRGQVSKYLKAHAYPELFDIYGNPGTEAGIKLGAKFASSAVGKAVIATTGVAVIGDHVANQTGAYKAVECKLIATSIDDPEVVIRAQKEVWAKNNPSVLQQSIDKLNKSA